MVSSSLWICLCLLNLLWIVYDLRHMLHKYVDPSVWLVCMCFVKPQLVLNDLRQTSHGNWFTLTCVCIWIFKEFLRENISLQTSHINRIFVVPFCGFTVGRKWSSSEKDIFSGNLLMDIETAYYFTEISLTNYYEHWMYEWNILYFTTVTVICSLIVVILCKHVIFMVQLEKIIFVTLKTAIFRATIW